MSSEAYDKAEAILREKGLDLTDEDVREIDALAESFTEEEKETGVLAIYGAIEQIRADLRSKLSDDGES